MLIIKENRTYDQVLGDLPQGNGDPSLVLYGPEVTPNHHRLAEQFSLLDNFYASGSSSKDGHQWLTQANATSYVLWPGYVGRSNPFDGSDPIAFAKGGFLWEPVLKRAKTVRVFGEFVPYDRVVPRSARQSLLESWRRGDSFNSDFQASSTVASLRPLVAPNFPGYTMSVPDVVRSSIVLDETKNMEQIRPDAKSGDHPVAVRPYYRTDARHSFASGNDRR